MSACAYGHVDKSRQRMPGEFGEVEQDALALPEGAEHRTFEGLLAKVDLRAIILPHHHTGTGDRVVEFDDALHV